MSQRLFHLLAASALLASACAAAAGLPVEEVAPGNFVHFGSHDERTPENLGDNANIGFVVGERCVAVIDTGGSLRLGAGLREAIRARTPLPVCYVVITHVHPDHLFGAAAFRGDHPQYIGHANLPPALAARGKFYAGTLKRDLGDSAEGSEIIVPEVLVKDTLDLDLGGRTLTVRAWPVGHTDNDLTVFDHASRTLWVADLLFIDHTPVVDGSITGFVQVLEELRRLPAQQFVAGHGRTPLPWPQALDAQLRYLNLVVAQTREAIRARRTIQDAVETVGLSEQGKWVNFELFHRRNVTSAYTELEWED
jgi:quinoprotein relay system zinc metallohydrolase 2